MGSTPPPAMPATVSRHRLQGSYLALALAVVFAVWGGSRGILSEDAVSTQGDMPRHLMNGVFLMDLAASGEFLSWSRLMDFAEAYYARYPALSLGHHPPLLPAILAPAFGVLGVSVFAGRVVSVATFLVAVIAMFALTRRLYDPRVAGWAAVFLATHPAMVMFGQQVMGEMLMMALVLAAAWQLAVFGESGGTRHFVLFAVFATLSIVARQIAVVALPAYLLIGLYHGRGFRRLRKEIVLLAGLVCVASVIVAYLTFEWAPFNLAFVLDRRNHSMAALQAGARAIIGAHLWPVLGVAALSATLLAIALRDWRIIVPLGWGIGASLSVLLITSLYDAPRYSLAAVPGFCLAAGALAAVRTRRPWLTALTLTIALAVQMKISAGVRPPGASGYETAARWIVEHTDAPTVMFSGPVDTGYFVFFMRKHDPGKRFVVLRSDKIFTTSLMNRLTSEERIQHRGEIYPILQRFGTRFIVIEDVPVPLRARPLVWFHEELKTRRFVERLRIPQLSGDRRLRTSALAIYEYLDATPPDPAASVDINIPLVGREIHVALADLLGDRARVQD